MRLDRLLSQAIGVPRSQAQKVIRKGEVRMEGVVVKDPSLHATSTSRVEYQGKVLVVAFGPQYFMLNKPVGYVCATEDSDHRTVLELLDVSNPKNLHIAGRLDIDATGLVLLTDDGAWSHRVMSPRHKFPKIYHVRLAEPLSDAGMKLLQQGVQLKSEPERCQPAEVERIGAEEVRITITEGKYHQVKRMFAAVGTSVEALHRERIGAVALDVALAPGASRPLTSAEVASFGSIS